MDNNRIYDVIVDHFKMKKKQSAISSIFDTEDMKLFTTVSKAYWKYSHKIFSCDSFADVCEKKFCQYNAF